MSRQKILLVYPKMGMSGSLVRHMPLSLLYAAIESLKAGLQVEVLDARLYSQDWRRELEARLTPEVTLVGVSVLTGTPLLNALEISRLTKQRRPDLPVVWGGPHASFNAAEILDEPSVDFVISGYGSLPLRQLAGHLAGEAGLEDPAGIAGLSFRRDGQAQSVPPAACFEMVDYRDIPYHLVADQMDQYGQLDSGQRIFPLYSAMGCPYNCAFCSSPALYRAIKPKYVTLPAVEVVDHIAHVHQTYNANYIYFIDDDSFVSLEHVEGVIEELQRRGLKVGLGFRGARINEIKRMSDQFLTRLAQAGTDILHIGAESGSQAILDLVNKNCTVEDIIEVNRKMARHPEIIAAYNWIVGLPGETMDDLVRSQQLILRLLKDNPSALMFTPNKYRPLPGTKLYDLALQNGYQKPRRLEEWARVEVEGDYHAPWYDKRSTATINMMQVTSYFVDNKLFKVKAGDTWRFRLLRLAARLYAPLARARLRHNFSALLVENLIFRLAASRFQD